MSYSDKLSLRKQLLKLKRSDINNYLIETHYFSLSEAQEWETKEEIVSDIIMFGWGDDCLDNCTIPEIEKTFIGKIIKCEELGKILLDKNKLEGA